MFTEIMIKNKDQLAKSGSYLLPQIDKMIGLLGRLESAASADFYNSVQHQSFAKGAFLLKEGEACKYIWFLETGICRQYMNNNGTEQVGGFYFPGEFIVSNIAAEINSLSKINLQFESTAIAYILHLNHLERFRITYPVLNEIEKIGMACRAGWSTRHNYMLHLTAVQRYNYIQNHQPVLLHRITLKQIASYLRMTPERLSRIRAKTKNKIAVNTIY